jgi:hypothetical protein
VLAQRCGRLHKALTLLLQQPREGLQSLARQQQQQQQRL